MRKRALSTLSIGALFLIGACSSETTATDEGTGQVTTTSSPVSASTTRPATSSTTSTAAAPSTSVAPGALESALAAAQDGDVSSFVAALRASGLAGDLTSRQVTIFAPDDGAFRALGPETVRDLLADPGRLKAILLDHVVEGAWPADELRDGTSLTALSGRQLTVKETSGDLSIEGAEVLRRDAGDRAVIVHVIDRVLPAR